MRGTPKAVGDRVADWLDGSDPRTTRRVGWGAVVAFAVAFGWPLAASDGGGPGGSPSAVAVRAPAAAPGDAPRPRPTCSPGAAAPDPRSAGLSNVSPSRVGIGGVVESTRWGRKGSRGLWGVAAVAECGSSWLDAVWIAPSGQKQRHRMSRPEEPAVGVVADGLDGAISAYSVRTDASGRISAILHISTDWGRTWEEREVPASAEGDVRAGTLSARWRQWPLLRG
ncbi:hypothetical protein [Knoellia aerolata]|uniref:Sialidase domain-containing protein n=1 Tax=Knoellia aerolata DSM 18566 TaxID=1385519 RepID=A0A0A0JYB6_9MICO|nr:hypothetical protein [Knoellia aerolata]KGN41739.1 hypothetical protein N801_06185 [Knoellia aerolata DSM 18566]